MKNISGDPSHYSSSDLATVDHIRDEAKKLYSLYIDQKVKSNLNQLSFIDLLVLKMYYHYLA